MAVFMVEIRIPCDDGLGEEMAAMRTWLDHERIEPSTFHCVFKPPGAVFRIDFARAEDAATFARAFRGRISGVAPAEIGAV